MIRRFPSQLAKCVTEDQFFTESDCRFLAENDCFSSLLETVSNIQCLCRTVLESNLNDAWMLYQVASHDQATLALTERHQLRWAHLGYEGFNDADALLVAYDRLIEVERIASHQLGKSTTSETDRAGLKTLNQKVEGMIEGLHHLMPPVEEDWH